MPSAKAANEDASNEAFLEPPQEQGELGRLGPYRVTGVLGQGGMGKVYQAKDTRLKRNVALKMMNKKFASMANSRKRFVEEARSMAAVHHDNVATIFEVGQKDGMPFMAMEILKGQTLEELLREGHKFKPKEVITIASECALGLNAAHERGIIHRDIKPANLWMQIPQNRVKILDFGLALAGTGVDTLSGVGSVVGTPGYLSPEQASNEPVDERTDLYSLGVVMYELCTGRLPLTASSVPAQLIAIISHDVTPFEKRGADVPRPLADMIYRLLSKDPGARPANAMQLHHELEVTKQAIDHEHAEQLAIVVDVEDSAVRRRAAAKPVSISNRDDSVALDASPTHSNGWKWTACAGSIVLLACVIGFVVFRPKRVAQTNKLAPVVSKQAPKTTPVITEESLQVIRFTGDAVGRSDVVEGEMARFNLKLTNGAASPQLDPRALFKGRGKAAEVVMFLKQDGQPKRKAPAFPIPITVASLPEPGKSIDVTALFTTEGLALASYQVSFELRTPEGTRVDEITSDFVVSENLLKGELLGFEKIRTHTGSGADTFVQQNSQRIAGAQKLVQLRRAGKEQGGAQLAFGVFRFDLSKAKSLQAKAGGDVVDVSILDRAVLLLTLEIDSHQGKSDINVYGWKEANWQETGKKALRWDRFPPREKLSKLVFLGQLTIANPGGAAEKVIDGVRFASDALDDFIRSSSGGNVTVLLSRENYSPAPTNFAGKERAPGKAAALAVRTTK